MSRKPWHIRVLALCVFCACGSVSAEIVRDDQAKSFLRRICYTRQQLEDWLSGKTILFGETYDSELGWVLADRRYKDGADGAVAEYRSSCCRRSERTQDRRNQPNGTSEVQSLEGLRGRNSAEGMAGCAFTYKTDVIIKSNRQPP